MSWNWTKAWFSLLRLCRATILLRRLRLSGRVRTLRLTRPAYFCAVGRQHDTCRWHTSSGITLGVRLSKLEMLNGRAFMIAGFGWDYGGNVISWNSGRLSDLECNGALILTLYGTRSKQNEFVPPLTSPEIHSISGDRPILSSTPAMQKLDPEVVGMLFEFPSANGKTCAK